MPRFFGTPDGIRVGQQFVERRELYDLHVHRHLQAGISGTKADGSDSIVVSGGYVDDEDHGDWIVYPGHGGNAGSSRRQVAHQSIDTAGDASLIRSRAQGLPVRVIRRKHISNSSDCPSRQRWLPGPSPILTSPTLRAQSRGQFATLRSRGKSRRFTNTTARFAER
jgi:hypothetical protein